MLRYVYAADLKNHPKLARTMFRDRADQFKTRLGWDVTMDENGAERDEYDDLNPLYVIWEEPDGSHGGSMRILPTTGQTMVNDHFLDLTDGVEISSPLIWECTRFCLSPNAGKLANKAAAALMLAGCELGVRFGLDSSVGVFDARMVHIYRRIGWAPEILGTSGSGKDAISVGLWEINQESKLEICAKSGIEPEQAEAWFDASFPVDDSFDAMVA